MSPGLEPRCPFCGYDLSGLKSSRCPECGRIPRRRADRKRLVGYELVEIGVVATIGAACGAAALPVLMLIGPWASGWLLALAVLGALGFFYVGRSMEDLSRPRGVAAALASVAFVTCLVCGGCLGIGM